MKKVINYICNLFRHEQIKPKYMIKGIFKSSVRDSYVYFLYEHNGRRWFEQDGFFYEHEVKTTKVFTSYISLWLRGVDCMPDEYLIEKKKSTK